MSTIKGVFFDLGGTLFSYRNVARTNIPILIDSVRRMNLDTSDTDIKRAYGQATKEISHAYGDKSYYLHHDLFHDLYVRFCEIIGASYDANIHRQYHEVQQRALFGSLELKSDCIETLATLKERGLYLSVVSNIDDAMLEPLVERENLHHYLDHWTSSETARSCKPDAGFFNFALKKASLDAENILFVGDSPEHDIAGAKQVGMGTVLIVEEGIKPPLQTGRGAISPDYTVNTLKEICALVE
mgnify:CR=1 FL=1|jgi:HAD superfamily hydrolase (TIGR01509 family)